MREPNLPEVKISFKIDRSVWNELRGQASESHQSVSDLLNEAIRDYLARRRVRPDVLRHLEASMREHDDLGRRLAR